MAGITVGSTLNSNANAFIEAILGAFMGIGGDTQWFVPVHKKSDDPTGLQGRVAETNNYREWVLESTEHSDILVGSDETQKYRMYIRVNQTVPGQFATPVYNSLEIRLGTDEQIIWENFEDPIFVANGLPTMNILANSSDTVPRVGLEYDFRLTITDHGWALGAWATSRANVLTNNFFGLVQRPVNPTTGSPKIDGLAPIFAMWRNYNLGPTNKYFNWAVIRELDRNSASTFTLTTMQPSARNMYKWDLNWPHPAVFDNDTHVVKFPYGFATGRYLYLDELDLMCIVNGLSFNSGQPINIGMYGEAEDRQYTAIFGESSFGSYSNNGGFASTIQAGGRIGILTLGGPIPYPEDEE